MKKHEVNRFLEFLKEADHLILNAMGGWRGPDTDCPALKELFTARLRYWLIGGRVIGFVRVYPTDFQLIREAAQEAWEWKQRDPDGLAHYCIHTAGALSVAVMDKDFSIRREGYALLNLAAWMAIRWTAELSQEEFVETAVKRYREFFKSWDELQL